MCIPYCAVLNYLLRCLLFLAPIKALIITGSRASSSSNQDLLILGLGRVGWQVAIQHFETAVATIENEAQPLRFRNVFGTVRSRRRRDTDNGSKEQTDPSHQQQELSSSIQTIPWQDTPRILQVARHCSHVLITIPPALDPQENDSTNRLFQKVVDVLFAAPPPLATPTTTTNGGGGCRWIGILSTTGVYGNHNGSWVTEDSPCILPSSTTPLSPMHRYLAYEQEWIRRITAAVDVAARTGKRDFVAIPVPTLQIFRCAGIYSPSQSALHTVYKKGLPTTVADTPDQNSTSRVAPDITNRIHVFDLAAAILASMQREQQLVAATEDGMDRSPPPSTHTFSSSLVSYYNLADDEPASRNTVLEYAAQLLKSINVTIPIVLDDSSSSATSSTLGSLSPDINSVPSTRSLRRRLDRKLVSNQKMRQELLQGAPLQYPSYRQGLSDILQDRTNPWWQQSNGTL